MSAKKRLNKHLENFCGDSTIHTVQYLAPSRSVGERLLWFAILSVALVLSTLLTKGLFENWAANPIVTTINTNSFSVTKISFPAVTVCPNGVDLWGYHQRQELYRYRQRDKVRETDKATERRQRDTETTQRHKGTETQMH